MRLYGDNTDWQGIYWPIARRLTPQPPAVASRLALIAGAGGTALAAAYAAQRLGLRPVFWNRTQAKAEALAARFGGAAVASLDEEAVVAAALAGAAAGESSSSAPAFAVVLSTLPPAAAFVPPVWVLASSPVVLDAVYTGETPLLLAAAAAGCACVTGAEMLVAQGLPAFAAWVGRVGCCGEEEGGNAAERGLPPPLPSCVPAAAMAAAVAASLAARA